MVYYLLDDDRKKEVCGFLHNNMNCTHEMVGALLVDDDCQSDALLF
jgi:hypothetical protein